MDALTILIVGDSQFLPVVQESVTLLDAANTVDTVATPREAWQIFQQQKSHVLIVQASQTGGLDLFSLIKGESRFGWTYCILVDQLSELSDSHRDSHLMLQQQLVQRMTQALQKGADAYVWLVDEASVNPDDLPDTGGCNAVQLNGASVSAQPLLQAQVQVGLRLARNHQELLRTNDVLSSMALLDPLTELSNRRALEWELPRQIQRSRERSRPLSLIMLDVDYFKRINDTYGHLVGDAALRLLSARLRHHLRFHDSLFRYGGEEFLIILSSTSHEDAIHAAHRLLTLVREQPFAVDDKTSLGITVSMGTACLLPNDDPRGISLIRRADQNLLRAKTEGRDRVISAPDDDNQQHSQSRRSNLQVRR